MVNVEVFLLELSKIKEKILQCPIQMEEDFLKQVHNELEILLSQIDHFSLEEKEHIKPYIAVLGTDIQEQITLLKDKINQLKNGIVLNETHRRGALVYKEQSLKRKVQ